MRLSAESPQEAIPLARRSKSPLEIAARNRRSKSPLEIASLVGFPGFSTSGD